MITMAYNYISLLILKPKICSYSYGIYEVTIRLLMNLTDTSYGILVLKPFCM
jgi:hypothetical protein